MALVEGRNGAGDAPVAADKRASALKVRIAVAPGPGAFDPDGLAQLIDGLEAGGFDTIWLSDLPLGSTIDPLVGLAFAAGRTQRLKLGANVVPLGRNPMLLAKELAQLDQLSAGRLLLSLVPGLDQPGEREALGFSGHRGRHLEQVMLLLRQWWAGEEVHHDDGVVRYDGVRVRPQPHQAPLELWLGGMGPAALDRVGRMADGWLGAAVTPDEAARARETIGEAAAAVGRVLDPEHFGLSIPYCRTDADPATVAGLQTRRPDVPVGELLPVGGQAMADLIARHIEAGMSKFVVRPSSPVGSWADELAWLADCVLPLQR